MLLSYTFINFEYCPGEFKSVYYCKCASSFISSKASVNDFCVVVAVSRQRNTRFIFAFGGSSRRCRTIGGKQRNASSSSKQETYDTFSEEDSCNPSVKLFLTSLQNGILPAEQFRPFII